MVITVQFPEKDLEDLLVSICEDSGVVVYRDIDVPKAIECYLKDTVRDSRLRTILFKVLCQVKEERVLRKVWVDRKGNVPASYASYLSPVDMVFPCPRTQRKRSKTRKEEVVVE